MKKHVLKKHSLENEMKKACKKTSCIIKNIALDDVDEKTCIIKKHCT